MADTTSSHLPEIVRRRRMAGIIPELPAGMSTIEVLSWLVTPSDHLLDADEAMQSPRDYLLTTNDAQAVLATIRTLRCSRELERRPASASQPCCCLFFAVSYGR